MSCSCFCVDPCFNGELGFGGVDCWELDAIRRLPSKKSAPSIFPVTSWLGLRRVSHRCYLRWNHTRCLLFLGDGGLRDSSLSQVASTCC